MWSKISSALKQRDGNESDADHSDAQSPSHRPPPDPFRINATTYYTHQTPPTPPSGVHSRTASREEDFIWSLRTQLALQQEMCAQFEIDLNARDELVEALTLRLEASEKENDKRKTVVRSWKKKAAELERMCRHLEEEVDNSRRESMGRSIIDEASGEALRQLHRQISQLEREKKDVEAERNSLAQTVENMEAELGILNSKLETGDEAEEAMRQLNHRISQLGQEKDDLCGERDALAQARESTDTEVLRLQEELGTANETNRLAVQRLHDQISQLEREKIEIVVERDALEEEREKANGESLRLQDELRTAEETNREALCRLHDQISQLEQEKDDFIAERDIFVQKEVDQHKLDDRISQLEREKGDIETERDTFSSEISRLRDHISQLRKESAVMEVATVQLNKQLDQNKEDINGLNIALESKQQELELVKRKHGARIPGTASRTISAPSIAGKPVGSTAPASKLSRTSAVGTAISPPVPPRIPSVLGRATNTRPPVSSGLRRASSSSVEAKTKPSNRRSSVTSVSSELAEKENISTPVSSKHPRRTMVPA
ncbi:hypothetical protein JVU11DRAFT_8870 [Chiua virens]|nr:hypothetical protein JVU11DRAFT_8870 [Chiua virens]